jgi:hypothetical protein
LLALISDLNIFFGKLVDRNELVWVQISVVKSFSEPKFFFGLIEFNKIYWLLDRNSRSRNQSPQFIDFHKLTQIDQFFNWKWTYNVLFQKLISITVTIKYILDG